MKTISRVLAILFAVAMLLSLCACAEKKPASNGPKVPASMREGHVEDIEYKGEKLQTVVHWIERDGMKIYGRIFRPTDFDESKKYPVLIMSHGYQDIGKNYDNDLVRDVVRSGMICYTFDFIAGSPQSKSDGKFADMTMETLQASELADLPVIIDDIRSLPFVDTSKVAVFGSSMGGRVTSMTMDNSADKVAAVILQAPAFNTPDTYEPLAKFNGKILVLWGTADESVSFEAIKPALDLYADKITYVEVQDAPHSFQPRDYAVCMQDINAYLTEMGVMPQQ